MPLPETGHPIRRAETCRMKESGPAVVRLYRCARDLHHWYVHIAGSGWVRFPARANGWSDSSPVGVPDKQFLNRVPLWLAFNTGLLEAVKTHGLQRAA
jgi:hypothetical protein